MTIFIKNGIFVIIYKCYYNAHMKYVALELNHFICRYYA